MSQLLPPLKLDLSNEAFRHINTIVGHLVIAFGMVEFGLDGITAIAYANGGSALRKTIPVQFSERTKFVLECAERLPALAEYSESLKRIALQGDRLAKIRNDIVHGYLAQYEEGANHLLTFAKAEVAKSTRKAHSVVLRKITAADLMQAGAEAFDIGDELATVNTQLLGLPMPNRPA